MAEEAKQLSTGTVKWFNSRKGYGFIATDDGSEDLFVHQTSIRSDGFRTLSEGQTVEFTVDFESDGRAKAIEVVAVSKIHRPMRGRGGGGGDFRGGMRGGGRFGGGRGGRCYNCGGIGHMARNCYRGGDGRDGAAAESGGYGGGGGRSRGRCYNCGEDGHFARECPNHGQN